MKSFWELKANLRELIFKVDNIVPWWRVVVLNTYVVIMKPKSVLTDNKLVMCARAI